MNQRPKRKSKNTINGDRMSHYLIENNETKKVEPKTKVYSVNANIMVSDNRYSNDDPPDIFGILDDVLSKWLKNPLVSFELKEVELDLIDEW